MTQDDLHVTRHPQDPQHNISLLSTVWDVEPDPYDERKTRRGLDANTPFSSGNRFDKPKPSVASPIPWLIAVWNRGNPCMDARQVCRLLKCLCDRHAVVATRPATQNQEVVV